MKNVYKEIEALTREEYEFANQMYPMFATPHEGYAVLLEELEETEEALALAKSDLDRLWREVRADDVEHAKTDAFYMQSHINHMIAEAVQVAAMCTKFMNSFEEKDNAKNG